MNTLVVILWIIYVSECFARMRPGQWIFRERGTGEFAARERPDFVLLDGRFGFAALPLAPWRRAFVCTGPRGEVEEVRRRLDALARSRGVATLGAPAIVTLLVVLTILIVFDLHAAWIATWAVAAVVAWTVSVAAAWRLHTRIHGTRPSFEQILMLLSPLAAARAPVTVSVNLLVPFHPLAVGAVLCNDAEYLRMARVFWWDQPDLRATIEKILSSRRLAGAFNRQPPRQADDLTQYCPRCHSQYTARAGACVDCGDIPLATFAGK